MSDVAQKRDLADPRTVRDFAAAVKSPTRLKLLTVLTVCDIRGVGPGVWNNWKAMLLRALYGETLEHLTGGSQSASRPDRAAAAREALAAALAGWPPEAIAAETARHYAPYWLGFDTRTHAIFAGLIQRLAAGEEPAIHVELDFARDATQVCFAMSDHPGIFARLAGALALAGANVVDARTYTSSDGVATAAFWIQDKDGKPYESSRLARLRTSVARTLRGEIAAGRALRDKDRIKRRERDFFVPTRITFDNTGSDIYTIIEVETRDRPGLLYDLARTLTANNVSIASRDHRDLRQAGGGRLLRQGPVRPEASRRVQAPGARDPPARRDHPAARPRRPGETDRAAGVNRPIRLLPALLTVGSWTMLSRVLGLARDVIMAALLGAGPVAQAFLIAFSLPNMFRRFFAEGAFNLAFVPMFAKKLEAGEDAPAFARDALSGPRRGAHRLHAGRPARDALAGVRDGLRLRRRRTLRPRRALRPHRVSLHPVHLDHGAAVGRAQRHRPLRAGRLRTDPDEPRDDRLPARRLAAERRHRAVADLVGAGRRASPSSRSSGGAPRRRASAIRPRWPRAHARSCGASRRSPRPAVLAGGVVQINLLVGRQVGSFFDGAVAWLSYADRLYQLPLGVVGAAIGVVLLPDLSRRLVARRRLRRARRAQPRRRVHPGADPARRRRAGADPGADRVACCSSAAPSARRTPPPPRSRSRSTAPGLPAFVLQKVVSPLYYARHDTRTPFRFAVHAMIVNAGVAIGLAPLLGFAAAALGTTIAGWVMLLQLWRGARGDGRRRRARRPPPPRAAADRASPAW